MNTPKTPPNIDHVSVVQLAESRTKPFPDSACSVVMATTPIDPANDTYSEIYAEWMRLFVEDMQSRKK